MDTIRREEGTTIIELTLVVGLLGLVIALVLSALYSSQTTLERNISRSSTNDQMRLAVLSLDREVRSGNVLYDPAQESFGPGDIAPGMSARIYTQSNDQFKCVQWRITSAGDLERRDWAPQWQSDPSLVHPWRVIASGIRNRAGVDGPGDTRTAFTRSLQKNLFEVDLWANADPEQRKGKAINVKGSISGRNTIFYTANELCGPAVPNPALTGNGGSRVPPY